jgi:hypothetical protein
VSVRRTKRSDGSARSAEAGSRSGVEPGSRVDVRQALARDDLSVNPSEPQYRGTLSGVPFLADHGEASLALLGGQPLAGQRAAVAPFLQKRDGIGNRQRERGGDLVDR